MKPETTPEILTTFRDQAPEPGVDVLSRSYTKLMTQPRRRAVPFSRLLRWGAVAVAASAVTAMVIGLLPGAESSSLGGKPASAAELLVTTAHNTVAGEQPSESAGKYLYQRIVRTQVRAITFDENGLPWAEYARGSTNKRAVISNGTDPDEPTKEPDTEVLLRFKEESVIETWREVDSGEIAKFARTVLRRTPVDPQSEFDRLHVDLSYTGPAIDDPVFGHFSYGWSTPIGNPDAPNAAMFFSADIKEAQPQLSTDKDELAARMHEFLAASEKHGAPEKGSPQEMLELTIQVLCYPEFFLTPQARKALLLVAADLPGLQSEPTEIAGRKGVAFSLENGADADLENSKAHDAPRFELIVDPEAGEILGFRETAESDKLVPGIPAGMTYVSVNTSASFVDNVETPPMN